MKDLNINLFCPYGTLDTITEFGQALTTDTVSCKSETNAFRFTPSTCDYNLASMGTTVRQNISRIFNSTCAGQVSCMFPLNTTVIPSNCTQGYNAENLVYYLQATCKSDLINVFFMNKLYLEKSTVALVVVLMDLGITFVLYLTFLFLRAM